MCLVAFQKYFQKIFSGVWLCSWKYHRKHIFYLLLTFSHIFSVAKRIYNLISQLINNETKPNKKKIIKSGQIHQNPTISQLRFEVEVERWSWRVRSRRALGSPAKSKVAVWVRFEVEVEWRSRRALGSPAKSNGKVGSGLRSGLWVRSFAGWAWHDRHEVDRCRWLDWRECFLSFSRLLAG